jgi:hypothetical protein
MCYGDIDYGRDGYYRQWVEEQMRKADEEASWNKAMDGEVE